MDWLDLLAVQGTFKSLLQHHSSKESILRCSTFFIVQLSHPYMTTGKTIALTRQTFVGKVMSMLFNMLSAAAAKSLQLCPALCDPMDCSLPGSSVHGIFQGRVLEWVAIAFSNMLSRLVITFLPRIKRLLSLSFPTVKQGERYLLSGFLSGFHEVTNIKKHSGQCLVRG